MTLRLVLSFLPPLATGWIVVGGLGSGTPPDWRHRLLRGALAAGLGLGLASGGFFAAVVLAESSRATALTADAALLLAALGLRRLRPAGPATRALWPAARPGPAWLWLLRGSGALAVGGALAAAVLFAGLQPHGAWDAWGIWNLRARFLFRGGADWRDGLSPLVGWSHPDYPLLLPGLVARAWWYAGRDTVEAPWMLAGVFAAATVALALAAVALLRGEGQGWLAAVVLVSAPEYVRQATNQLADVPLAFFYLAAVVALGLADQAGDGEGRGRLAVLGGLALGLAAWTKNEGLAGALAVLLVRLAVAARGGAWRRRLRVDLAPTAAGLAPMLLAVAYFKLRLAPPSEYLSLAGLARLADTARYADIARGLLHELRRFGDWPISLPALLAAYTLARGVRGTPAVRGPAAAAALTVVSIGAAYVGAYLITPHPLVWQLRTSLSRLMVQLWPAAVFAYFLWVTPPEAARAKRSERR